MPGKVNSADALPFIVISGPPGAGKTVDVMRAVGIDAVVAAAPGALKPLMPLLGITPRAEYSAATIEDAIKGLQEIRTISGKKNAPRWYVADEFSYMAERTAMILERKHSGFKFWGKLRDVCTRFRDAARDAGVGVIVNCWDQPPQTKASGKFVRGGPRLPGDMPEQFPGIADYVFLAAHDMAYTPWPWCYRTRGDTQWALKDRTDQTPDPSPMNLGAILRESGYKLHYPEQMRKLEPVIADLAATYAQADMSAALAHAQGFYPQLLKAGVDPRYAKWALTDARDRGTLRRARTIKMSAYC
jgi:hypothetical protein